MQIENKNERTSRISRMKKKKRTVFGLMGDDVLDNSEKQIKFLTESQNTEGTFETEPHVKVIPYTSSIMDSNKLRNKAANDSYSQFMKNQIYYGQNSYGKAQQYERVENIFQNPGNRDVSNEIQETNNFKKQRKLKRKQRMQSSNFQQIVIQSKNNLHPQITGEDQTQHKQNQIQEHNSKEKGKCEKINKIEHAQKTQNIAENKAQQKQNNQQHLQSNSKHIPISFADLCGPQQQLHIKSQQQTLKNQIGISSISTLFALNSKTLSLKTVMYSCTPKDSLMKCYIKRIPGFNLTLEMYLDDDKFLMKSLSQSASIGCNHYISVSKDVDKNAETYLGKLRSDFLGSIYTLYDNGVSEKQAKGSGMERRTTLANVEYGNNILGIKGPRRIKVVLPNPNIQDKKVFKLKDKQTLSSLVDQKPHTLITLSNRKPGWNQKLKTYALNFGGRVKMPSIKNFILENKEGQGLMTFGKIDSNTFTLQFRYPLSPYQAFGIALTSFDFKLNCE